MCPSRAWAYNGRSQAEAWERDKDVDFISPMDMAIIEKELQRRINQSEEWLQSAKAGLITGLNIRSYPCQVKPIKFLEDQRMKARHGVLFRLEFSTQRGQFEAYVETRIMPFKSLRKDGNYDYPFVACYSLNTETNKRDLITWDFVQNINFIENNKNKPIEEWYKGWLFKALIHKNVAKIFNVLKKNKCWDTQNKKERNS